MASLRGCFLHSDSTCTFNLRWCPYCVTVLAQGSDRQICILTNKIFVIAHSTHEPAARAAGALKS